jgi:predicted RNase H-like nuclease (RuvC/YqgF family)
VIDLASFTDKLKTGLKNTDSLTGQKIDEAKYDNKISEQKSQKRKAIEEAGEKMFDAYAEGKTELTAEVKELYEKAKACDEEIKKLEAEKEELKQKAHEEREARRNENQ